MDIEKLVKDLGKTAGKLFFNKEEKSSEKINFNQVGSGDILKIVLKRLVHDGDYNKAENILFDEINKNASKEIYEIGFNFYNVLLEKDDEGLKEANFTREEIYQGLEEIKELHEKQSMKEF